MKNIKVLGSGCANCKTTLKLIEEVAQARGVAVNLEKVDDMAAILGYGVMSTPRRSDRRQGGTCRRRAGSQEDRKLAVTNQPVE